MEVWLVLHLFGILIGLAAANSRGLGTAQGVIGGLLLGPFAFLMFLCSGGKKRCDKCGEWIDKHARICPFCTREVEAQGRSSYQNTPSKVDRAAPVVRRSDEMADAAAGLKPCPNCGEKIFAGSEKCRFCGMQLNSVKKNRTFIVSGVCSENSTDVTARCPVCGQKFLIGLDDVDNKFVCPDCQSEFMIKL